MKTNREILLWVKKNLSAAIQQAIVDCRTDLYPESLLAAMACRETGIIIAKHGAANTMPIVSSLTRGDFTQRPKDTEKKYHGYGFWQIDIDSYPDFIKVGDWKDARKCCIKAITVLDEKRRYIVKHFPNLPPEELMQATIAAYNCGQGNVVKVLKAGANIDSRTAHGNYSKSVLDLKREYESLSSYQ